MRYAAITFAACVFVSSAGSQTPDFTITPLPDGANQLVQVLSELEKRAPTMTKDIVIEIGDGTIQLTEPIRLNPNHSGTNFHTVYFRAAPNAKPIISSARQITAWKDDGNGRWSAKVKEDDEVTHLYINNVRANRARGPFPDGAERYGNILAIDGDVGFKVADPAMSSWKNADQIVLGFHNSWSHMIGQVHSLSLDENGATKIRMQQPGFMLMSRKEGVQAQLPAYIENAEELLDEPGEWYFDPSNDLVHYLPRPDEDMNEVNCTYPTLSNLLLTDSEPGVGPHNIQFEGITFADAGNPNGYAPELADVQANFMIVEHDLNIRDGFLVNFHNEYVKSPACIRLHSARSIVFDRCTFTRLGGAGIDINGPVYPTDSASQFNTIRDCEFYDISGSAIQIGDVNRWSHHPTSEIEISRDNRVENCTIHDIGVEFEDSVGIFAGYVQNTVIEGNEIYNLPYSGISIGWGWGEEDAGGSTYPIPYIYETPTPCKDNHIANNHIHHVMQKRQDGGGVYTLGNMPGTVIEGNHIHDNIGWPGGIYLDEGSGFIEVRNNKVYNVHTPMNFNNRNQNRIDTCNVHDNEFVEKK